MSKFLTSKEVATLLNVNESTVKRWADNNKMICHKTIGGHRKFLYDDVRNFAKNNNYRINLVVHEESDTNTEISNIPISEISQSELIDKFYQVLLTNNSTSIYTLLNILSLQYDYKDLFDNILQPTLYRLGAEWEESKIDVGIEHAASSALMEALGSISLDISKQHAQKGKSTIILCVLEGDYHEIPIKCLSIILQNDGWNVINLGANTPLTLLNGILTKYKAVGLAMSCTVMAMKEPELLGKLEKLSMKLKERNTKLILGGSGFNNYKSVIPNIDFWGTNFTDTTKFINSLNQ